MKILLINDPGIPVPPHNYGGIERIVYQLAQEYTKLGHEVTLLAGPDSHCAGRTIHFGKNTLLKSKWQAIKEIAFVWWYLLWSHKQYDVVHSFGRLVYLLPILNKPVKKIMSYQREVTVKNIQLIHKLPYRNLHFTGCSDYISQKKGLVGSWHTVYNFVDISQYTFVPKVAPTAPLVFLGRLDSIKGCHHCIALAKRLNHPLVIAGNISHLPHERAYYEQEILPHIDGNLITYIGAVNDVQKNELLGHALALLMLIDWDEPFGIVMAEAMACGTPVVGFARGAVPEVVEHGVNGLIIDPNELAKPTLITDILQIKRVECRTRVETMFTLEKVANQYLKIYTVILLQLLTILLTHYI